MPTPSFSPDAMAQFGTKQQGYASVSLLASCLKGLEPARVKESLKSKAEMPEKVPRDAKKFIESTVLPPPEPELLENIFG